MSVDETINAASAETIAEAITPAEPATLPIDHAEELMAVKLFYESRTVGLRAALRKEQAVTAELTKTNIDLNARLEEAERGLEDVREEIVKLSTSKSEESASKVGKVR
ncbi:hypothetical protein ACTJJ7_15685 [Phyllobacterium sp. 22229]|uniref:hypothetical protein n=1 Tax=Phyllobacterium sp. 22229 TaxID=3453895 RepID=UPI003F85B4A3